MYKKNNITNTSTRINFLIVRCQFYLKSQSNRTFSVLSSGGLRICLAWIVSEIWGVRRNVSIPTLWVGCLRRDVTGCSWRQSLPLHRSLNQPLNWYIDRFLPLWQRSTLLHEQVAPRARNEGGCLPKSKGGTTNLLSSPWPEFVSLASSIAASAYLPHPIFLLFPPSQLYINSYVIICCLFQCMVKLRHFFTGHPILPPCAGFATTNMYRVMEYLCSVNSWPPMTCW